MADPATLLFPAYRRKVLGLLLLDPESSYHVREIARLTGTTPGTLNRELALLTEAGLLTRTRTGNQVSYQADIRSPIFEELASIARKTFGLADVLKEALAPLAERIAHAFVFGSAASGRTSAGSDIDVIIIGDGIGFGEAVALLHPKQEVLGREINPRIYTRDEWRRLAHENGAFYRDILAKPRVHLMGDMDESGEPGQDRPA